MVNRNTEQHNLKSSFGFKQQAQAVTKTNQMFYDQDDDDDEDLRILTSDENFGQDPEFSKA